MRRTTKLFVCLVVVVLAVAALCWWGLRRRPAKLSPPPQFAALPTGTDDYTCAGTFPCATWAMPAQPAAGAGYTDAVYGTTTYRLAVPANSSTGNVIPAYSRVQAFNEDGTRLMMSDGVQTDLYDATTTPPTPISQISTTDGSNIDGISGDALWGNTEADKNLIFFNSPSGSIHGLELRYVDVSTCTASSCTLEPHVLHTFACQSDAAMPQGAGKQGNKIETGSGGQGGMFDQSDRYFFFSCDWVTGNGRNEIDLIRYDRQNNTVTQIKWYHVCPGETPQGCTVMQTLPAGNNLFRMSVHPDGQHVSIIWQSSTSVCPSAEAKWTRSCGTEFFDKDYQFLGPASSYSGHQDMGYDVNGEAVFVGNSNSGGPRDYRALEIVDLDHLDPTKVVAKHILLPCSFSYIGTGCESGTYVGYAKSWHISMTAWPRRPGWALFSTMMMAGTSLGAPRMPVATTLGTAVSAGTATVTPASMTTIGPGVLSLIGTGSTSESVVWTATTATTATATFAKAHSATEAVQCISCGNTGWGAMDLIALKIDAGADDWSNFEFYRIGRDYGVRDANYNCEPHATVDRDFQRMVWGSSWNGDCDTNPQVTGYFLSLAKAPPQPSATECTAQMNADGTVITDLHCTNLPVTKSSR